MLDIKTQFKQAKKPTKASQISDETDIVRGSIEPVSEDPDNSTAINTVEDLGELAEFLAEYSTEAPEIEDLDEFFQDAAGIAEVYTKVAEDRTENPLFLPSFTPESLTNWQGRESELEQLLEQLAGRIIAGERGQSIL